MQEILDSITDKKIYPQKFIKKFKRGIIKGDNVISDEILTIIKNNSFTNEELFEIYNIIENSLKQTHKNKMQDKDEYSKLLSGVRNLLGEGNINSFKDLVKIRVSLIIQKSLDYKLKDGIPKELNDICVYFFTLVNKNEIQKVEVYNLDSMFRNVFKSLKNSGISSEKVSDIKNLIKSIFSSMNNTIEAGEIIGVYEKLLLLVSDEKGN